MDMEVTEEQLKSLLSLGELAESINLKDVIFRSEDGNLIMILTFRKMDPDKPYFGLREDNLGIWFQTHLISPEGIITTDNEV